MIFNGHKLKALHRFNCIFYVQDSGHAERVIYTTFPRSPKK
jgi:hypothetical protein